MTTSVKTLGIIGTGPVGRAIARRAVDVGIAAILSNSRGPESLRELVEELGSSLGRQHPLKPHARRISWSPPHLCAPIKDYPPTSSPDVP